MAARVLVVDDSPTIRRVVAAALQGAGYDVVVAAGGEAGLSEARAARPDLVLLDFVMPGMNGYQFIKAMDGDDALLSVPVVLMCTRSDQIGDAALRQMGVLDTITKPFSPEAILAVATWALEKHGLQKRAEPTTVTSLQEEADTDAGAAAPPPDAVADDLARLLADALAARGVDDADGMARAVTAQVAASLSSAATAELVKRALGPDALRRPVPALVGDLAAVPLPEVLQLLKLQGQTGLLEVSLENGAVPARVEIAFARGAVVAVRARNVRGDLLLGRYFVARGIVDAAGLDALLAQPSDGRPLGQRLVDEGRLTPEELVDCLGEQAKDLMYEMLRARRGAFGLRRGDDVVPTWHVAPGFSVDALLFEGLRRIDEWSVVEKEVPSFAARFVRVEGADLAGLTAEEAEVLALVPRAAPVRVDAIVGASRLRAYDVCQLLYRLVVLQRVQRVDDGAAALVEDEAVPAAPPAVAAPDARRSA
jgi:CheY-like chemotaxis protein